MKYFDFENLKATASTKSTISFDIFDTLLLREVTSPLTILEMIEKYYGYHGFKSAREQAEIIARRNASLSNFEDVSISEIYAVLRQEYGEYSSALHLEYELERKHIKANMAMSEFLDWCKSSGKTVIAVSDMYLDQEFVSSLLTENHISVDAIYVSSHFRKLKRSTQLFKLMLDSQRIDPSDCLHIGDNWECDVLAARLVGISAVLYPKISIQASASGHFSKEMLAHTDPFLASTWGRSLIRWQEHNLAKNSNWWIGYNLIGPFSLLFLSWIYRHANAAKLHEIYFLLRDGEVWAKIWALLFPDIKASVLYGNRKILQSACLADLLKCEAFPKDHFIKFRISHGSGIREVCSDLDLGPDFTMAACNALEDSGAWDEASIPERESLFLQLVRDEKETWETLSDNKKSVIQEYFESKNLIPERREEVAMVDIGWRLSSYQSLSQLLGFNPLAFFVGIAEGAYYSQRCRGFLFEYGAPTERAQIYSPSFVEVMETLFGGTEPTALSVEAHSESFIIHYDDVDLQEERRIEFAKEAYEGALDYASECISSGATADLLDEDALILAAYSLSETIKQSPPANAYKKISSIYFSAHAGKSQSTRKRVGDVWRIGASIEKNSPINGGTEHGRTNEIAAWAAKHARRLFAFKGIPILESRRRKQACRHILESGFLDEHWYLGENPDVRNAGIGAIEHYVTYGVFEGRNPNRVFSTYGYLATHEDVRFAGLNPLIHYIEHGQFEGRGH